MGIHSAVISTDERVDAKRVAILGVSRLGKTVLWAGAHDTRIAMVIASCSGEGGAALSRRNYGETIAHLTAPTRYPYQFAANYAKYAAHPEESPVDAHMLIALSAPRPVFITGGTVSEATFLSKAGATIATRPARFFRFDHVPGGFLYVPDTGVANTWSTIRVAGAGR